MMLCTQVKSVGMTAIGIVPRGASALGGWSLVGLSHYILRGLQSWAAERAAGRNRSPGRCKPWVHGLLL